jgi:hypothetical protein
MMTSSGAVVMVMAGMTVPVSSTNTARTVTGMPVASDSRRWAR